MRMISQQQENVSLSSISGYMKPDAVKGELSIGNIRGYVIQRAHFAHIEIGSKGQVPYKYVHS